MSRNGKVKILLVNAVLNPKIISGSGLPLGILYIATVLYKAGYLLEMIDLAFDNDFKNYRKKLLSVNYDIVGFTANSGYIVNTLNAAKISKEINPECINIIGGAHATAEPVRTLKNLYIDFIVSGEGELTILELVQALKNKKKVNEVKGIYYKNNNGEPVFTGKREFIANLDEIPFPNRKLLPTLNNYLKLPYTFPLVSPLTSISSSRGCYGNCSYCQPLARNLFGSKVRQRSPENVVKEIQSLVKNYKVKSFWFVDDTVTASVEWMSKFAEEIKSKNLKIEWRGSSRVNLINEKNIKPLKDSGCIMLCFGVESGSQKILKVLQKGTKVEQAFKAIDLCRKANIISIASIMIGNPTETKEDILETAKFLKKLNADMIKPHITSATPGSYLYYDLSERFEINDNDFIEMGNVHKVDRLSDQFRELNKQELEECIKIIWKEYREGRKITSNYIKKRIRHIFYLFKKNLFKDALLEFFNLFYKGSGSTYKFINFFSNLYSNFLKKVK